MSILSCYLFDLLLAVHDFWNFCVILAELSLFSFRFVMLCSENFDRIFMNLQLFVVSREPRLVMALM